MKKMVEHAVCIERQRVDESAFSSHRIGNIYLDMLQKQAFHNLKDVLISYSRKMAHPTILWRYVNDQFRKSGLVDQDRFLGLPIHLISIH
jgi:hypothetical protein